MSRKRFFARNNFSPSGSAAALASVETSGFRFPIEYALLSVLPVCQIYRVWHALIQLMFLLLDQRIWKPKYQAILDLTYNMKFTILISKVLGFLRRRFQRDPVDFRFFKIYSSPLQCQGQLWKDRREIFVSKVETFASFFRASWKSGSIER